MEREREREGGLNELLIVHGWVGGEGDAPMVSPRMLILSVLRTPWVKPTACQWATSLAVLFTTSL